MSATGRPDPLRDDALDAAWRAHSTELPPPHVDAAILAAAHREARARPRAVGDDDALAEAREPSRAWWGFAAAATIGAIAFGIMHMLPPEESPRIASDMPSPTTQAKAPSADVAASRSIGVAGSNATPGEAPATQQADRTASSDMAASQPSAPAVESPKSLRKEEAARARRDYLQPAPVAAVEDGRRFAEQERSQAGDRAAAAPASPPAGAGPAPAAAPPPAAASANAPRAPSEPQAFPGASAPLPASPPPPAMQPAPAPPTAMQSAAPASQAAGTPHRERVAPSSSETASDGALSGTTGSVPRDAARHVPRKAGAQEALRSTLAPDQWVERIVELYDAGKRDDAARELRAFRDAYADADARLPASLRTWAAGVRR